LPQHPLSENHASNKEKTAGVPNWHPLEANRVKVNQLLCRESTILSPFDEILFKPSEVFGEDLLQLY